MFEISIQRIRRYALILGVAGSVTMLLTRGAKDAVGFIVGAAIALLTIESWSRVTIALNPEASGARPSVGASAIFLVLRYALIGGAIYAIVKVLGVTPVAMLLGLLVSFAAVVIELLQQSSKK